METKPISSISSPVTEDTLRSVLGQESCLGPFKHALENTAVFTLERQEW